MVKAQQLRWIFLCTALAATITTIVMQEEDAPFPPPQPVNPQPLAAASAAAVSHVELSREWIVAENNPFAPRYWIAPPPAPIQARTVAAVTLNETPPPPAPMPLPFRFLGRMTDGEDHVIYLGQGELLVAARKGDVLDGHYKVLSIAATQMEFEDTTLGLRQLLPLPVQDR